MPVSLSFHANGYDLKSDISVQGLSKLLLHLRVWEAAEDTLALDAEPVFFSLSSGRSSLQTGGSQAAQSLP